jgi:hypothetical protein
MQQVEYAWLSVQALHYSSKLATALDSLNLLPFFSSSLGAWLPFLLTALDVAFLALTPFLAEQVGSGRQRLMPTR